MNKLFTLAATVCISNCISTAVANNDLPELVITAKGEQTLADVLPTSHVLTAKDIQASQAMDIPDLIDQISGINISDSGGRGSQTGVFLRGTSSSQTIVLIDGVRVGSASLGSAALNNYPIEALDRIEVVKGPLSGIYGADAVGGVIQLFTKKIYSERGAASLTIGSNNLLEYGVSLNGGNQRNSFAFSANKEDTDGIDRTSTITGGNADKDGFTEDSFSFAAKSLLSDSTTAELSVLYSKNKLEFDDAFGGVDAGLFSKNKTLSSAVNITSKLSDNLTWATTIGNNKDEAVTPAPSAFPSDITTKRNSIATEVALKFSTSTLLTLGTDYYDEEVEALVDYPVTDRDNKGLFAMVQSDFDKWAVVASLRHDDNSAYGSDTNGNIALNYNFSDSTRAVLSYGTAFVAPSFNFLYFPYFGNPDLLPEESESVELSLLGSTGKVNWRVSAYQTEVVNLFSFDPSTFLAANVGEAELKGLELSIGTELANWQLSSHLDLLSAKNKDTGIELDDRAERTLKLSAMRDFGDLNLRFDLKAESNRYDYSGIKLSGYGLLDVNGSYQINDKLTLLANIDNLFDKNYVINLVSVSDHYNTLGRQAKVTLRYNF